jgi:TRAP-type C4-dicarboxylate transport system substrate-binding protein
MAMTDILTGLSTRMIEGLPTPPLAALAFQWNRYTPYMLEVGLAPVVGATVVSRRAWNKVGAGDRPRLIEAAAALDQRVRAAVPAQDAFAVLLMRQQGLTVTKATMAEWRKEAESLYATMRGQIVPADIFDLATRERDRFRQRPRPAPAN